MLDQQKGRKQDNNSSRLISPQEQLIAPDIALSNFEDVYKRLFSSLLQLNPQLFDELDPQTPPIVGTRSVQEQRIFLSQNALTISLVVLALNIVVAAFVYTRGVTYFLPRVPMTLGSTLGYIVSSRIASPSWLEKSTETNDQNAKERTYSLGYIIGPDGQERIGIDTDPYVTAMAGRAQRRRRFRWRA